MVNFKFSTLKLKDGLFRSMLSDFTGGPRKGKDLALLFSGT